MPNLRVYTSGMLGCRYRCRLQTRIEVVIWVTYAVIPAIQPSIPCQVKEPGLSPASGFEHPASTSRLAFLQRSASARLPAA